MLSDVRCSLSRGAILAVFLTIATVASAQNDLTDIPEPDPAAEAAAMTVDPVASVNRFASDPDISKPIQINFDASGGLWIASSEVYPQIEPGAKADDKIIVLRDTDGDGVSDSRMVFADGLLIPTGVLPDGLDAAYVAESTQLVHLKDTDGDGRADQRRVILSGFGTEDTHHLLHTLRWGPDGCLYFNQSIYIHSHIDTTHGTQHLDGGGIWRYRPSTGELQVFCKGFINPWGHIFDAAGESFVTDGAYFEGINYAFPDAVFVTSPGATRWLHGLNPGSPKHCGLEVLSGGHIPPEWSGDLITSDFRSHRVCRFTVKPNDSGYVSRQQPEIITSEHVAFRPIDARMGPDGAIYVADWYNPIIQHGEVDFRDERRDREHGRIWRISFPDRPLDPWASFSDASIDDLLTLLEDDSLAVRQFAREELWRREPAAVRQSMAVWQPSMPADASNSQRLLERLWYDEQAGEISVELAMAALNEPAAESTAPAALRPAMRSVWRQLEKLAVDHPDRTTLQQMVLAKTVSPHPSARLEAVVCCGQLGTLEAAKWAIEAASLPLDANLDFALWQTLSKLESEWVEATKRGELNWTGKEATLAMAVSSVNSPRAAETILPRLSADRVGDEHFSKLFEAAVGAGNSQQLAQLLALAMQVENLKRRAELLDALISRTTRDGTAPESAGELLASQIQSLNDLLSDEDWARSAAKAAAAWKASSLEGLLIDAIDEAPATVQPHLVQAVGSLESARAKQTIQRLATGKTPELKFAAIASLIKNHPQASLEPLIGALQADAPQDALLDLVAPIVEQKDLPRLLAERLAGETIPADSARALLRRVRSAGGSEPLEAAIRTAGKLDDASWKLTPELAKKILSRVQQGGSPESGEAVYRRAALQCIQCHAIGPAGGVVGPNLISLGGSSQPDYILESLIDPSAKLKEGYTTLSLLTDDGRLISGIVIGRDEETVRLRLADASEVQVATESIEQEMPGKSLMPAGLLDELTETELVDLVAFLSALGRVPEWTVGTDRVVRSFEVLTYTADANHILNRTSTDAVAGENPAFQWRSMTAYVDGSLPLSELDRFQQHRDVPPTSFIRFDVLLPEAGKLGIHLPAEGIESWVDGKPTPVWSLESAEFDRGTHRVILSIDHTRHTEPFRITLTGEAISEASPATTPPPDRPADR